MQKIKILFRRKYLFWKYKHNNNTGKVIITKEKDRQLGLTTLMLNDCIKNGYVLLVPNQIDKKRLAYELCTKEHIVRRHIVGGANRTLISVETPLRLCRTGTCRRLQTE